jgi:hypothetical protein
MQVVIRAQVSSAHMRPAACRKTRCGVFCALFSTLAEKGRKTLRKGRKHVQGVSCAHFAHTPTPMLLRSQAKMIIYFGGLGSRACPNDVTVGWPVQASGSARMLAMLPRSPPFAARYVCVLRVVCILAPVLARNHKAPRFFPAICDSRLVHPSGTKRPSGD